jgi:hypothetical protein
MGPSPEGLGASGWGDNAADGRSATMVRRRRYRAARETRPVLHDGVLYKSEKHLVTHLVMERQRRMRRLLKTRPISHVCLKGNGPNDDPRLTNMVRDRFKVWLDKMGLTYEDVPYEEYVKRFGNGGK